jgi:hypothetical protein
MAENLIERSLLSYRNFDDLFSSPGQNIHIPSNGNRPVPPARPKPPLRPEKPQDMRESGKHEVISGRFFS